MPREEGNPEQAGLPRLEQDLVVELAAAGSDPTGYVLSLQGSAERPTNFLELAEVLGKLQGVVHASDDCVVIRTDGQVRWQHAVDAYNAAVKAKYTNVRFERAPR